MAVLFGENLFKCKCGYVRFEEIEIKSYNQIDDKTLKEYETTTCLKCTECGHLYPTSGINSYKIV